MLLPKAVVITTAAERALRARGKRACTIFNYNETHKNDSLRSQQRFEGYETDALFDFTQTVKDALVSHNIYNPEKGDVSLGDWTVLVSHPGCQQQHMHSDYDRKRVAELSDDLKPFGAVIALQDNTKLVLVDSTVVFNRGDILVFRGDTVHAGASYDDYNVRVHVYGEQKQLKGLRVHNKVYLFPNSP